MAANSKILQAHEEAKTYKRIKSKHIIENLFVDFKPWNELEGFNNYTFAPSGKKIEFVNDPSVIIGTGKLEGTDRTVAVIAQQTPSGDEERIKLNFGMVKADGYGLSLSMMEYAEENDLMLYTFIDTVGGDPYEYSAEKLQSWLISYCQSKMINLKTKSVSTVIGLGGSGGAIAIQLGHKRYMLSRAEYSVITAEGCSAILFRSADKIAEALEVLQPTADYMLRYGIIDEIIKEPSLDKSDYLQSTLKKLKKALIAANEELDPLDVNYLRKNLRDKIEKCGQIEKQPNIYKGISKKIKTWLPNYFRKPSSPDVSQMQIALYGSEPHFCNDEKDEEGKTVRAGCKKQLTIEELHQNLSSCPYCNKPETLGSDDYLNFLIDENSFHEIKPELSVDNIDFKYKFFDYSASRQKIAGKTDSKDSLVTGYGTLYGIPVAIAVCDFRFMGGSMSAVFGEKMKIIADYAISKRLALITITVSGGARMQEGTVALYQMAKTIAAISKLKEQGLPHISILGHPTTGGALASYAVQGDYIIAEKKAIIAFAGDRVVKLTSGGRGVDPEIMYSEFYMVHGGIHLVIDRGQMKSSISGLLQFREFKNSEMDKKESRSVKKSSQLSNEDWI
ncbi:MAG: carboxyl transferase domain-containing protein [Thermodesulfobacteriota bacterium]